MNADCYFEKGNSHLVCEDYALAGTWHDLSYAIVCDGCSDSKHTDLGARLQAHIAREILFYLYNTRRDLCFESEFFKIFQELVIKKEYEVQKSLGLSADVFDATLLICFSINGASSIYIMGDGSYIDVEENRITVNRISYDSGAPYYLSYELSESKKANYKKEYSGKDVRVDNFVLIREEKDHDWQRCDRGFFKNSLSRPVHSFLDKSSPSSLMENTDGFYPRQEILCSDGFSTYRKKPTAEDPSIKDIDISEIILEIVDYKVLKGEFVKRRLTAFSRKNSKKGIVHEDDIACAAINISKS